MQLWHQRMWYMHFDFTRKCCYAFWLHQKTYLCVLTSPANTAMHSDCTRKHCYAFWHHQKTLLLLKCCAMFWLHQKTLLCILTSSHTGPICKLNPPTRPLLCTAMSLKQRLLQWLSLLHKSHQWNCFSTIDFLHEKRQNGHTTQSWWKIIDSCRESWVHVSMQFLLQGQTVQHKTGQEKRTTEANVLSWVFSHGK